MQKPVFYDNHVKLSADLKSYGHYLLMALYRRMAKWMEFSKGSGEKKEARAKIKEIKRKNVFDFLFCKHEPILYKIGILLMLGFPFCSKFLLSTKRAVSAPLDTIS